MSRHISILVDRLLISFHVSVFLSACKTPRNVEWIIMKIDSGKFITNFQLVKRLGCKLYHPGFGFPQWREIFICSKMPRMALGLTLIMRTGDSFPGREVASLWSWPVSSIWCRGKEWMELHLHSCLCVCMARTGRAVCSCSIVVGNR